MARDGESRAAWSRVDPKEQELNPSVEFRHKLANITFRDMLELNSDEDSVRQTIKL